MNQNNAPVSRHVSFSDVLDDAGESAKPNSNPRQARDDQAGDAKKETAASYFTRQFKELEDEMNRNRQRDYKMLAKLKDDMEEFIKDGLTKLDEAAEIYYADADRRHSANVEEIRKLLEDNTILERDLEDFMREFSTILDI